MKKNILEDKCPYCGSEVEIDTGILLEMRDYTLDSIEIKCTNPKCCHSLDFGVNADKNGVWGAAIEAHKLYCKIIHEQNRNKNGR